MSDSNENACGPYMITASGARLYPLTAEGTFRRDDIAHGLSQIARYSGALKEQWSVAQHAVLCSRIARALAPRDLELQLLAGHHDDAEYAGINDVIAPLKHRTFFAVGQELPTRNTALPYGQIEDRLLKRILPIWGLSFETFHRRYQVIKQIDRMALWIEVNAFMVGGFGQWDYKPPEPPEYVRHAVELVLRPVGWRRAMRLYVDNHDSIVSAMAKAPAPCSEHLIVETDHCEVCGQWFGTTALSPRPARPL